MLKPQDMRYIVIFYDDSGMPYLQCQIDFYLLLRKYNMMHRYYAD